MPRLILIRHAKSDWSAGVPDRERPLNDRGRRQAPPLGEWLGAEFDQLDLAVVSVATRAQQTWELIAAHLDPVPQAIDSEQAYTFDGEDLADLISDLPPSASTVILVAHNPALEELIRMATGQPVGMPTSSVAVLELETWDGVAEGTGTVLISGRPADGM